VFLDGFASRGEGGLLDLRYALGVGRAADQARQRVHRQVDGRFAPSDVAGMRYDRSMGIQVFDSIPLSRIIGKAVLTVEDEMRWRDRIGMSQSPRWMTQLFTPRTDGLIARLTAQESTRKQAAQTTE